MRVLLVLHTITMQNPTQPTNNQVINIWGTRTAQIPQVNYLRSDIILLELEGDMTSLPVASHHMTHDDYQCEISHY